MKRITNSFVECQYQIFENYIYIDLLEITPEFRGKGFGTAFMCEFIEKHRHLNLPIRILVLDPNVRGFWEKLGFKSIRGDYYTLEYRGDNLAKR